MTDKPKMEGAASAPVVKTLEQAVNEANRYHHHRLMEEQEARMELIHFVREAHKAGSEVATLARLAGVTRHTIYSWIRS